MQKTIHFKIVTPERVVFEDTIDEVIMPTVNGEIAVLPEHEPLVTLLKAGVLRIKKGATEIPLAVSSGVIEIDGKKIVVLADSAERADELEEEKIEKAKEEAKHIMESKRGDSEGFAQANAALERELARLKVVRKYRRSHGHSPTGG
ncbi:MAG: ATP synthase F1 subunit epsilon [Patescibacteria group bacterium]